MIIPAPLSCRDWTPHTLWTVYIQVHCTTSQCQLWVMLGQAKTIHQFSLVSHTFILHEYDQHNVSQYFVQLSPLSSLLVTSHCTLSTLAHGFCVRTGCGVWGHPQGDMHMVAARLGCERAMVGTWWLHGQVYKTLLSPCRGLVSGREGCLGSKCGVWKLMILTIACSLMSGQVKVTSLLIKGWSGHGFSFGVRAWTEMEIKVR